MQDFLEQHVGKLQVGLPSGKVDQRGTNRLQQEVEQDGGTDAERQDPERRNRLVRKNPVIDIHREEWRRQCQHVDEKGRDRYLHIGLPERLHRGCQPMPAVNVARLTDAAAGRRIEIGCREGDSIGKAAELQLRQFHRRFSRCSGPVRKAQSAVRRLFQKCHGAAVAKDEQQRVHEITIADRASGNGFRFQADPLCDTRDVFGARRPRVERHVRIQHAVRRGTIQEDTDLLERLGKAGQRRAYLHMPVNALHYHRLCPS